MPPSQPGGGGRPLPSSRCRGPRGPAGRSGWIVSLIWSRARRPKKSGWSGPWVGLALVPILRARQRSSCPLYGDVPAGSSTPPCGVWSGPASRLRPGVPRSSPCLPAPPTSISAAANGRPPERPFLLLGIRGSHRVELAELGSGSSARPARTHAPELRVRRRLGWADRHHPAGRGRRLPEQDLRHQAAEHDRRHRRSSGPRGPGSRSSGQAALQADPALNQSSARSSCSRSCSSCRANTDAKIRIAGAITAKAALGPVAGAGRGDWAWRSPCSRRQAPSARRDGHDLGLPAAQGLSLRDRRWAGHRRRLPLLRPRRRAVRGHPRARLPMRRASRRSGC